LCEPIQRLSSRRRPGTAACFYCGTAGAVLSFFRTKASVRFMDLSPSANVPRFCVRREAGYHRGMKPTIHPRFNQLRKYRKARGLSQIQAARLMGLKSTARLSRWEKGTCMPNSMNMLWLAATYHVLVDALFIDMLRDIRKEVRRREERIAKRNCHDY
jgi:DNA-binding XRE family transcriptional regulator